LPAGAIERLSECGAIDTFGTIHMIGRADLVLLDANPLENIANTTRIAGVMVRGRWIPKSEIDRQLAGMRRQ
jgi:imidazolonepropionase-like amidohydrolase